LRIPEKQIPTTAFVVEKPGAPFVLQNVILDEVRANDKRSSWFLDHECGGWDLFFWDHDDNIRIFL
jgi:hypothetical protein